MALDQLDTIARAVAAAGSRRALFGALAGGLLGLSSLPSGLDPVVEAAKPKAKKKKKKVRCPKKRRCGKRCCRAGTSCRGRVCRRNRPPGPTADPNPQPNPNPGPDPEPGTVLIRRNVHGLGVNGPELEALARGIAVMKQRPESDPTSWLGQANVHLNARHGSVHFLSWHRMYLYWFERILRRAAGDDTLTLPYWNYIVASQRVLPAPFMDPGSALYIPQRNPQVNNGQQPNPAVFNMQGTMEQIAFMHSGAGASFGGSVSGSGYLENAPHNGIHTWVGGEDGFMGDIRDSPKDPLFWLHHANIDRMWEAWLGLGGGRANTSDPTFLNTVFQFYDENGAPVQMTGSQVINTASQLGYRYDDQAAAGAAARSISAQGRAPLAAASKVKSTVLGATAKANPVTLGRTTTKVAIPVAEKAAGAIGAAGKRAKPKATLSLNGVSGVGVRGLMFNVFVGGAGKGANVGSISLFGLHPDDHHGHGHTAGNMSFDITNAVAAAGGANKITVTLEPVNLTGTGSLPAGTLATIDRMIITVQGAKKAKKKKKLTKQQRKKARLAKKARLQKQKAQQKKQRTSPNKKKRTVNRKQKQAGASQLPVAQQAAASEASIVPGMKSSPLVLSATADADDGTDAGHAHH